VLISILCPPFTFIFFTFAVTIQRRCPKRRRNAPALHGGEGMLIEYIETAMSNAKYELINDEEPYYGEVPELEGVWATERWRSAVRIWLRLSTAGSLYD